MADQGGQRLEVMTLFPRHVPSSAHDTDLKRNNFRLTTHPHSLIVVALKFSEFESWGGGGEGASGAGPLVQTVKKCSVRIELRFPKY